MEEIGKEAALLFASLAYFRKQIVNLQPGRLRCPKNYTRYFSGEGNLLFYCSEKGNPLLCFSENGVSPIIL